MQKLTKILFYFLVILSATILSIKAIKNIKNALNLVNIYKNQEQALRKQYIQLIKKQLELEYVSSPLYKEEQLRNSLNYYEKGEKVIIFTKPLPELPLPKTTNTQKPANLWRKIILY